MSTATGEPGRSGQKLRTRTHILATASALISAGQRPTVTQAADAAQVSRRTAYRYFPSQEKLLAEAALEGLRPSLEAAIDAAPGGSSDADLEARLVVLVRSITKQTLRHEQLLRTMVHSTVLERSDRTKKRGTRRIDWIEQAVRPARSRIGRVAYEQLLSGLALCVGIESLLVLRDIRGLKPQQVLKTTEQIAIALLRAAMSR